MSETVQVRSATASFGCEIYSPAATANSGVIVIAYGSDGMTDPWARLIRDYATELSRDFTVLIPDYLGITSTPPGIAALEQVGARITNWQAVIRDAVQYATSVLKLSEGRIGLLGFSLGGHLCLRARDTAKLLVEFFAPELEESGGIGAVSGSPSKVQIHHGLADPLVPFKNAERIQAKLASESTDVDLFRYEGAGHGFVGSDVSNATAQRSSRERTLTFFRGNL